MKQQIIEWKEVALSELGGIVTGNTPPRNESNNYGGEVPWIKPPNLDKEKFLNSSEEYLSESGVKKARLLPKGSVLVSCIGNLGKVGIADVELCTNQQINSIIPKKEISSEYLYYTIKKFQARLEIRSSKAVVPLLNKSEFSKVKIPIPFSNGKPDIKEQERIVSILEKSEKLKERGKRAEALLEEYLRSIFNEMFYNKGFEEVSLGGISKISMGGTPLTSKSEYWQPSEIDWMKSGDIKGDIITKIPQKISKEGFNNSNTSIYPKGTVVIALNGQGKTRGTSAILGIETCSNQSVSGIIPNKEKLVSEYLHYNLKLRYNELRNITGDDSRSGLNLTIIRSLKIPLPPIPLQQKFAKIVEQVEKMKVSINKTKNNSEELFNSLMQKAFMREV